MSDSSKSAPKLRSRAWFDTPELYGWLRQAAFKAQGFGEAAYEGRPVIGICNSWSTAKLFSRTFSERRHRMASRRIFL